MATHSTDQNPLRARLRPGERLLWEGQPAPRRASQTLAVVVALIIVSAVAAAAIVPLLIAAALFIAAGAPALLVFVVLPLAVLVAVAVRGVLRPGGGGTRRLARAFYAVTDQRVLIQTGGFSSRYLEMDLDNLPPAVLSEDASGLGNIFFGQPPPTAPGGAAWAGTRFPPAFYSIEGAEQVFRIVGNARRARLAG